MKRHLKVLTKINNNMPYSTCCGAHTNFPEIDICPDCLEHCDWEDEDEDELEQDRQNEIALEQEQIKKNENNGK
jgi:hypothetical protein